MSNILIGWLILPCSGQGKKRIVQTVYASIPFFLVPAPQILILLWQLLPVRMSRRIFSSGIASVTISKEPPNTSAEREQHTRPVRLRWSICNAVLIHMLPDAFLCTLGQVQLLDKIDDCFGRKSLITICLTNFSLKNCSPDPNRISYG